MSAAARTRHQAQAQRCLMTGMGSRHLGMTLLWGAALLSRAAAATASEGLDMERWRQLEDSTNTTSDGQLEASTNSTSEDDDSAESDEDAQSIFAEVGANVLLFLLIFGMSATVDMKQMRKQLSNKFAIMTGVSMQFVIMPFLGFVSVSLLRGNEGFSNAMAITLLIVTASPGGAFSNWWCSTFNADLALSVAMTALSTILSTFLLPANLVLYAHLAFGFSGDHEDKEAEHDVLANLNWRSLFTSLAVVISAILSGLWTSSKVRSQKFRQWANRLGTFSGIFLMGFSAVVSSSGGEEGEETGLWSHGWTFYVGVSFPCLAGLLMANFLSRLVHLSKPESVTLSVECCYQNVGIATSAAVAMFSNKTERGEALSVPLLYGIVEAVVLGLYCVWAWKAGWTKAPANEALCTVVSKSYEIEDEEPQEGAGDDADAKKRGGAGGGPAVSEGHPGTSPDHLEAAAVAPPSTAGHEHHPHHQQYYPEDHHQQYYDGEEQHPQYPHGHHYEGDEQGHYQHEDAQGHHYDQSREHHGVATKETNSPSWQLWKSGERGRVDSTDAHTATTGTTRTSAGSALSTPNGAQPEGTLVEVTPSPLSTPSIVTGGFTPLNVAGEEVAVTTASPNFLERLEKAQDYGDLPHDGSNASSDYVDARAAMESSGHNQHMSEEFSTPVSNHKTPSATSLGMDDYYITSEEAQASRGGGNGDEFSADEADRPKSLPSVQ